jgi:hypothetical protein
MIVPNGKSGNVRADDGTGAQTRFSHLIDPDVFSLR